MGHLAEAVAGMEDAVAKLNDLEARLNDLGGKVEAVAETGPIVGFEDLAQTLSDFEALNPGLKMRGMCVRDGALAVVATVPGGNHLVYLPMGGGVVVEQRDMAAWHDFSRSCTAGRTL